MPPTNKKHAKSGKGEAPVDKLDPADGEAVETEPSTEVIREHRFPFHKDFVDEDTGELRLNDRTELIDNGKSVPPLEGPQVRLSFKENALLVKASGSSDLEIALADLVRLAIEVLDSSELLRFFRKTKYDLVFSFGANGSHFIDPEEQVLAVTYLCLALSEVAHGKMDRIRDHVTEHRRWTFSWDDLFALTFDSCQPSRRDGTGSRMLENFREQYKEAQQAREEIDAKREEWLHSTAEPLLDAMEQQLLDSSLPSGYREELQQLLESLREDSYGYSELIDSAELQEILDISSRRAQELSRQRRLGKQLSRFYVHSRKEAENFSSKERPTGKHRKK